jgi:hypothetical protein
MILHRVVRARSATLARSSVTHRLLESRSMRLVRVLAGVACLTSIVLAGTAPAIATTSTRGSKFCGQLLAIRTANEAPPPSSDPTHGETGLALLAKRYDKLERLAPAPTPDTGWLRRDHSSATVW